MPRQKLKKPPKKKETTKKRGRPAKKQQEKETPKKESTKFEIDYAKDVGSQFIDHLHKAEPKIVKKLDNEVEEYLGCKRGFYSGLPTLDRILGIRANSNFYLHPYGKMIEVYGPNGCGKTTYMFYLAAKVIADGGIAYYVDWENKADPNWLYKTAWANFGLTEEQIKAHLVWVDAPCVEWFNVWIIQTMKAMIDMRIRLQNEITHLDGLKRKPDDYLERRQNVLRAIQMPCIIINDSIAGMSTEAEVKGEETTTQYVAELAREFGRKLKRVRNYLRYVNGLMVFTNQERDVIGGIGYSKIRTPGGNAVKYLCDACIRIVRINNLKRVRNKIETFYGTEHQFETKKNQLGIPPFHKTVLRMLYDRGYFSFYSLIEACASVGLIKKVGSRYIIESGKLKFEFEENACDEARDEIIKQYPTFEAILHNIYQNFMRQ